MSDNTLFLQLTPKEQVIVLAAVKALIEEPGAMWERSITPEEMEKFVVKLEEVYDAQGFLDG